MSFLSLDRSQNDSCLTVFLTKGKRVFHMSILSLVRSGNGFASGRLSYGQACTYRPRPTYYVTILVFVCLYVCTTLSSISSSRVFPSGSFKSELKSLATKRSALRGCWMMAATMASMDEAFSGSRYHPTAYHCCPPRST